MVWWLCVCLTYPYALEIHIELLRDEMVSGICYKICGGGIWKNWKELWNLVSGYMRVYYNYFLLSYVFEVFMIKELYNYIKCNKIYFEENVNMKGKFINIRIFINAVIKLCFRQAAVANIQ